MTPAQVIHARPRDVPFAVYKQQQALISRRRLYPITAFYTGYSVLLLVLAFRTAHPYVGLACYLAGIPVWMLVEYFFHRFILHGRFKHSKKWYKKFYTGLAHKYLDPLHWEHHERPFDGLHMSGKLSDLLPLFVVAVPLSFIFPLYTLPMVLAAAAQGYVTEEWVHHCVHFYNFRNPYIRYMKKHHFYHHTRQGMTRGFGTSSGVCDVIFQTRYPEQVRQRMYGRRRGAATLGAHATGAVELDTSTRTSSS
jgi:4-hydroxysphinganine ceramide fatty acyl 2-hydroxylase